MDTMLQLIQELNNATLLYDKGCPSMTDKEWDDKYFQLIELERTTGIVLDNSPTNTIIYHTVNSLAKCTHNHEMLSLDKTKEMDEVFSFLHGQDAIAMCKMDGLTCSLRYLNGKLISAETRGNGLIGEDIFHNALVISSIPNHISYTKELVIDGEVICTYDDFVAFQDDYKNPRNFAAGSIRLLNSKECEKRKLTFVAWDVISGIEEETLLTNKLDYLSKLGFITVPYTTDLDNAQSYIQEKASYYNYPIDGIVFKFNDINYSKSLGKTSHHFKNAIAYKFYDETYPTKLLDIEWSMGRTGVLTPIAIFEPVEIDGSTVERASLHNISIMYETLGPTPYVNQDLEVFKANAIIPQISWANTAISDNSALLLSVPSKCPVCGSSTTIKNDNSSQMLICINNTCEGKFINKIDHFCGKKGLDIKGLSKMTFEKIIDWNWVAKISDVFELEQYRNQWIQKDGFGVKSVDNILNAIESSKVTTCDKFIAALGIPLVGTTLAKLICKQECNYSHFREDVKNKFDFTKWDGIGWEISQAILKYDYTEADDIWNKYLKDTVTNPLWINNSNIVQDKPLKNKTIVITGSLHVYKNRAQLQEAIEQNGGKVVGSVSKNTDYLINNDVNSTSSKNVTAKKLNIPILTEPEFVTNFLTL